MCGRVMNWTAPTWEAAKVEERVLTDQQTANTPLSKSFSMRLACGIQNLAKKMHRRESKDDLRQRVARVTLDKQQLEDKVQDLRSVFSDLHTQFDDSNGCCFPFTYIMLRDTVADTADLATRLQGQWYGTTEQCSSSGTPSRGGVNRLVEMCKTFAANRQALNKLETTLDDLRVFKYEELEQLLKDRESAVSQLKVVFSQLQDLLKRIQELHARSQQTWLVPRYLMLKNGTHQILASFSSMAPLALVTSTPGSSVER